MIKERGINLNHITMFRWIMIYAIQSEQKLRPYLFPTNKGKTIKANKS